MADLEALLPDVQQAADPWAVMVQGVAEDGVLYLYLNRPETLSPDSPDFGELLTAIRTTLAARAPHQTPVEVYSRPLGQEEVDHHQTLLLTAIEPNFAAVATAPTETVSPTPSPEAPAARNGSARTNLADFCFVRNRMLLEDAGDRPNAAMIEALQTFHDLSREEQLAILNTLADWLAEGTVPPERLAALPATGQTLMQTLQSDKGFLRNLKTWLSRYCANPEATMALVQPPPAESVPPPPTALAHGTAPSRRTRTPSSPRAEITVDISGLSAFQTKELPLILGTCAIVGGLALLMNHLYTVVGWWALFIVLASIGSGVAALLRQPLWGAVCFTVLLMAYGFAGFGVVLVVPLASIGGLVGILVVIAMKMAAPRGGNLFSPPSLRLLLAVGCVLLLINGQGVIRSAFSSAPPMAGVSRNTPLKDHRATGTFTLNNTTFTLQSGFAVWAPLTNRLTVYALARPLVVDLRNLFLAEHRVYGFQSEAVQRATVEQYWNDAEGKRFLLRLEFLMNQQTPMAGKAVAVLVQGIPPLQKLQTLANLQTEKVPLTALSIPVFEPKENGNFKLTFQGPLAKEFLNLNLETKVYLDDRPPG